MREKDYPALYQAANNQSATSQSWFVKALIANFACIVIIAIFSAINLPCKFFAMGQTFALLVGIGLTVYLAAKKPQQTWYGTRALAESIKTVSWRYMMRAEPYNVPDEIASRHFLATLRKLFDSNRSLTALSIPLPTSDEITQQMRNIRALNLAERKSYYCKNRIDEQRGWYRGKSSFNRRRSFIYLCIIILIYLIMIGFSIARPSYPNQPYWPTDVFLAIASILLTWTQTKRYQELSASYALTAHEISLLRAELPPSQDEREFSSFVGDAENAFSREHTQWQARRDRD